MDGMHLKVREIKAYIHEPNIKKWKRVKNENVLIYMCILFNTAIL